jgi:ADP-dependent NAD(P)H-hydrate dehydratase / NAD(P)H-hydrate epimerase
MTNNIIVTAHQMHDIENRIFSAGFPVAGLMEKVAGLITLKVHSLINNLVCPKIGILVGPGHNGGDALVTARELFFRGYHVKVFQPVSKLKELTSTHSKYVGSLGVNFVDHVQDLADCDVIIDGLFGFGLQRVITDDLADIIHQVNSWQKTVISIDIPSGLHTDTGEVLGVAIKANYTLCLGLWKLAFFQESALEYVGKAELIDFNIPQADINAVLGNLSRLQVMTKEIAIANLPLNRAINTHKYKQGHLLLICGSKRYAGAAILAALGARNSGVGMVSIAVPESIKAVLLHHVPEALIIGCPETDSGAISRLTEVNLNNYTAIACGCGLTKDAENVVKNVLNAEVPLILDADGLNILAHINDNSLDFVTKNRKAPTILTPHLGEFKRLFPEEKDLTKYRISAIKSAAEESGAIVLLKGAKTAIASPHGTVWIINESTPALARGGSGDILTGLMGGLLAQKTHTNPIENIAAIAAWWHAQAGILAAQEKTLLGVDPLTLSQYLIPSIAR